MDPVPVLYVHYGDEHMRGSERALLDLFAELDRSRVRPFLWCNAAPIAEASRRMDVPCEMSPLVYVDGPAGLLREGGAVGRQMRTGMALIRRHGARVVHANSAAPVQWMSPAARWCHVPLVAHLHTAYSKRNRFVMLLHQAALAVGVSSSVLEGLRRDGIPDSRLRVIFNGIDPHRLGLSTDGDLREALGIPVDACVIGVAGSLIPRKATDVVLQALERLSASTPPWLLVAGDGPDRARLEALAESLGISGRTRFIGDYTDAGAVFRTMDIHALASKDEAFGLVLVEAALCGVPSVASDVGGIRDVIMDGVTGLRVAAGDVTALAAALQTLLDDAETRRGLGAAARGDALQRFSPGRMAAGFHEAYQELLALEPRHVGVGAGLRAAKVYARLVPGFSR